MSQDVGNALFWDSGPGQREIQPQHTRATASIRLFRASGPLFHLLVLSVSFSLLLCTRIFAVKADATVESDDEEDFRRIRISWKVTPLISCFVVFLKVRLKVKLEDDSS